MRPRRVGTFLMSRRPTSAKLSARSRMRSMSARSRPSTASRCFIRPPPLPPLRRWPPRRARSPPRRSRPDLLHADVDALPARGRQVLAHVVGPDRKLAVPAVDERRQLDAPGAAVVEEGLDRRAGRAAGEEDVVDQDHGAALEVEVEVRGVDDRCRAGLAAVHVVAVEGDIDVAQRDLGAAELADQRVQAARQQGAAGVDADQGELLAAGVLLDDLVRDPHQRAAQVVSVEDDLLRGLPLCVPLPGLSGPG